MTDKTYYLAIDFGASSGRHILGTLENGQMEIEEIWRFSNGVFEKNGHLCWDYEALYAEVLAGLRHCREIGKIPRYMAIDTWAVDFVLLDGAGKVLGDTVAYRDSRTDGMAEKIYGKVPYEAIYRRTGIIYQPFNTLYQLAAVREQTPALLAAAHDLLMTPSYFGYLLTGKKANEYTDVSSTQLLSAESRTWDRELIETLGLPTRIFGEVYAPGKVLGNFTPEVQAAVGFDCTVLLTASHDTAAAVAAVPYSGENFVYISSGTWSLVGVELEKPNTSAASLASGFTNEGGVGGRYRYLKNIMGLWMIQSAKKEWEAAGETYSFSELCDLAREADAFPSRVSVSDNRFLAPESMIAEIRAACREGGYPVPESVGEVAAVIYHSLAEGYRAAIDEIERNTGRRFDAVCIVGGGSRADYLNELTAKATGRTVLAGPGEATAIGNLAVQMVATGAIGDLAAAREIIRASFHVERVEAI